MSCTLKLSLVSIALSLATGAYSKGLYQEGVAMPGAPISTYGVEVATKVGLKSILPKSFKLYVHKDVQLPSTISWAMGESWVSVLEKFSRQGDFSIYLNWTDREIFIKTEQKQAEDMAVKQEVLQAAVTPLPKYSVEKPEIVRSINSDTVPKTVTTPKLTTETESAPSVPEQGVKGTTTPPSAPATKVEAPSPKDVSGTIPVATSSTASTLAAAPVNSVREPSLGEPHSGGPVSTSEVAIPSTGSLDTSSLVNSPTESSPFMFKQAHSLVKAPIRDVVQSVVDRHGYRLLWRASEVSFKGPVTVLGESMQEDISLIIKAIGKPSPFVIQIDELTNTVFVNELNNPMQYGFSNVSKVIYPTVSQADTNSPASSSKVVLEVLKGATLENSIYALAKSKGITVEWKIAGGFEANRNIKIEGDSLEEVLKLQLTKMGLLYTLINNHLTITPGNTPL